MTETGRAIDEGIVDGRVVVRDRVVQSIDKEALREEMAELMTEFRAEFEDIVKVRVAALPICWQLTGEFGTERSIYKGLLPAHAGDGPGHGKKIKV